MGQVGSESDPAHSCNGERNSRTLFIQGPRQGYLRHAQIALFGELFDTSGGREDAI